MAYVITRSPSSRFGSPTRLGSAPAIGAASLGVAAFNAVKDAVTSGDFSSRATIANYVHANTPPTLAFRTCRHEFLISAHHPRYGFGRQNFWFELTFEHNGHDLRNITINALVDKSSTMTMSTFSIEFSGLPHSVPLDPVAEVAFQISGRWNPVGSGQVALRESYLYVRADGRVRLHVTSELGWVRHERITGTCPVIPPMPPPAPRPIVTPFWEIHFSPPGSARIREGDERKLVEWYQRLLPDVRRRIEAGELPIRIDGYASTTQPGPANRVLSRRRAETAQKILQDIAGSQARFDIYGHGEYQAGTPDRVESLAERRVKVSVTYQV
jgi:hypothetical protein